MLVEHDLHALVLSDAPLVEKAVIKRSAFRGIVIAIWQRDADRLEDVIRGTDVIAVLAGHVHHSIASAFAGVLCYAAPALAYTGQQYAHQAKVSIEQARGKHPQLDYQRNTVWLRFCHTDYHKGAALAELARLLEVPRENIFAAGDHHNDISMLDGKVAAMPSCPANAIPEVQEAVRNAGGYVAQKDHGAGVHEALFYFVNGKSLKH